MRTATQIAEQVDFIGALLNTDARTDYFSVSSEFLVKHVDKGMEIFADIILHPTFPKEEIERECSQRLASLDQIRENPRAVANEYFKKLIYAQHPYGNQSSGTTLSLGRMTRDAIVKFYEQFFLPNNALLVTVGDFQTDEMFKRIKQIFDGWKQSKSPSLPTIEPKFHKGHRVVMVNKPDVTQTQIRIGNIGVNIKNLDRFAIDVANTIFGGGFTSRLVNEIRVKNSLTYGVYSDFSANLLGGSYLISTFTKNATVRKTIDITLLETKKLRENGVTEQELKKAKNYIAGNFARGLQAPENLTSQLSTTFFYDLPEDYLQTYVEKIKRVTLDDVKLVVKKYFQYDDLIIMVVTNLKETEAQMEGLGTIEKIQFEKAIE